MKHEIENKIHDLVIIGAGPAGLSASIYASRYGIKHKIVGALLGGQISETHKIDNYPGMEDMSGFEFSQKWGNHAKKYGVEILPELVEKINKENNIFSITLANKNILHTKTIILATGTKKRKLNIIGEKEFIGKGVSYCATCDGFFYKNKTVGVIGGSDSAATATLYLADLAEKVYLIYRKKELRAEPFWVNLIKNNKKIEVLYETNVVKILGEQKLEKVKLDREYKNSQDLNLDGLFIEAGSDPAVEYFSELGIELDENRYIKIQKTGATNISGIFAAGDITDGSDKFRQVITAASEGAIAVRGIYNFLKKNKE
ncbi:MAG: FAD-dependent oxidoreductase [Parcubacteria group bacterium]|jgi:thioredoxin reductase (NADPH)